MFTKVIHAISDRLDRLGPVVIAEGAEVEWDKGGATPEQWDRQGKKLFADFERHGVGRRS